VVSVIVLKYVSPPRAALARFQVSIIGRFWVSTEATAAAGLPAFQAWRGAAGGPQAVLESTGVNWQPVWHALEAPLTLVLAHATAVRNRPGRKSDRRAAQERADLLAHGVVPGRVVPPAPSQALRALTRTRRQRIVP
jgi:transposase